MPRGPVPGACAWWVERRSEATAPTWSMPSIQAGAKQMPGLRGVPLVWRRSHRLTGAVPTVLTTVAARRDPAVIELGACREAKLFWCLA